MTTCEQATSGDWQIEYVCGERPCRLQARFLVDATGRAALAARRQGATRLRSDRLTGVIGLFEASQPEQTYRTLVEASADGWWYSAWLPHSQLVLAFMTDADLLPQGHTPLLAYWLEQIQKTVHTRLRTTGVAVERPLRPLQWITAASEVLDRSGGTGWLAIGDAALSFDPLSSQGIYKALQSGLAAAATIEAVLQGQQAAVLDWSVRNRHQFDRYLRTRQAYYSLERRWPDSVFWRRRHG